MVRKRSGGGVEGGREGREGMREGETERGENR